MISPDDLIYFLEVAHVKSFSKAALKQGKSQPAISAAVKRIENELGEEVFHRIKSGIVLTETGKMLMMESQQIINQWNNLKNRVFNRKEEYIGDLNIGCHPTVGMYTLHKFVPELLMEHKKVNLNIVSASSLDVLNKVVSFELDLALIINPIAHPDLILHKVCDDKITFFKSSTINNELNDVLSDQTVLICNKSIATLPDLMRKYRKQEVEFKRIVQSESFENTAVMVAAGAGIGFLPARIINENFDSKIIQIEHAPYFSDQLYLVYRVENKSSYLIRGMVSTISRVLKSKINN